MRQAATVDQVMNAPFVAELFEQFGNEASNQFEGATMALAHNSGGSTALGAMAIVGSQKG